MAKLFSWLTVMLLMTVIFNFSHQPVTTSNDLSKGITERMIETVGIVAPIDDVPIDTINHIVRKSAHFAIYFFLGIFVLNALKKSGVNGYRSVGIALLTCMTYAVSDEFHQLFVIGRGAQVMDVVIDSMGATIGCIFSLIIGSIVERRLTNAIQIAKKETL